jgi:hypothetical protein
MTVLRTARKVRDTRITLAHGSGGKAMHDLIEDVFVTTFDDAALHPLEDQARLPLAELVARGDRLAFTTDSYVENVGNLVCPALFDLGEGAKVVMLSVTEGDDKPLKYPHMFRAADIVIITKSDLLPHVDFSIDRCLGNMRTVNRSIRSFVLSAITGEGVGAWYDWLKAEGSAAVQASVQPTSAPFRPGRQTYRDRPRFRLIYRSTTH